MNLSNITLGLLTSAACLAIASCAVVPSRYAGTPDPFNILCAYTWKSDKPGTISWIESNRKEQAKNEKLLNMFGKLSVTYSSRAVVLNFGGVAHEHAYVLLGSSKREVAMLPTDDPAPFDDSGIFLVHFDEDFRGYWSYNFVFDVKEHFIRME